MCFVFFQYKFVSVSFHTFCMKGHVENELVFHLAFVDFFRTLQNKCNKIIAWQLRKAYFHRLLCINFPTLRTKNCLQMEKRPIEHIILQKEKTITNRLLHFLKYTFEDNFLQIPEKSVNNWRLIKLYPNVVCGMFKSYLSRYHSSKKCKFPRNVVKFSAISCISLSKVTISFQMAKFPGNDISKFPTFSSHGSYKKLTKDIAG